jgi:hypothetical protein
MMGRYQIQLLDNDGNPVDLAQWAGAYPDQSAPQVSPVKPQGEWQTLEVVWQAPRFDNGSLQKPAQATVLLNDTLVQSRVIPNGANRSETVDEYRSHPGEAPLRLEATDDPVQFRNVWYRDLNAIVEPDDTTDTDWLGLGVGGALAGLGGAGYLVYRRLTGAGADGEADEDE